jgi:hypothetical protein
LDFAAAGESLIVTAPVVLMADAREARRQGRPNLYIQPQFGLEAIDQDVWTGHSRAA